MKDVTPKSNWEIILRSLGIAFVVVCIIALLKLVLRVFLSVIGWIIPIAIFCFIYMKYKQKK